jgi:hypothetical protein
VRERYRDLETNTKRMFSNGEKMKLSSMKKALANSQRDEMIRLNKKGLIDKGILNLTKGNKVKGGKNP